MKIEKLELVDFEGFIDYLNDHLSDNGCDGMLYFQPLPRDASRFPAEKAEAFKCGMQIDVGRPGWRQVWVLRDVDGRIAGHVDLRAHPEAYTWHRCLLGMGVARHYRRRGLGQQLLAHADNWALVAGLQWVDLHVLSVNTPAITLYENSGFCITGEIPNMFHFDGQDFSYISMSKRLR